MLKYIAAAASAVLLSGCVAVVDQPYVGSGYYPVRGGPVYRDPAVIYSTAPVYIPPAPPRYYNVPPGVPFGPRYGGYYAAPRYRHPYRY